MEDVDIRFDSHETKAIFSALENQNLAFATAKALTMTAKNATEAVREDLPNKFIIRRPWIQKGVTFQRAEKSAWPRTTAIVGSRDAFMVQHEEGGKKKPKNAHIALPRGVRENDKELVPARLRPKRLKLVSTKTPQGGRPKGAKTGAHHKPKPFVAIPRAKKMGIYIRTGDGYYSDNHGVKHEKFRLLWRLWDKPVTVQKKEWLYKTVHVLSVETCQGNFNKAMEEAIYKK